MNGNVTILCRDNNRRAIYLSNGMVIDMQVFDTNGTAKVIAELKQTDRNGVYAIVGSASKSVTGYFDVNTKTPTYLGGVGANQSINIGSGTINLGDNGNTGFGGVATGTVTLDSILGSNSNANINTTHTADVSNNNTSINAPVEEVLEYIDGYKFLPIPTNYTILVTEKISGTAAKWKIKIKQSEKDNGMTGKNAHNDVYNTLSNTAKETIIKATELPNASVMLFGSSSYAVAYMLSDNSNTDVTITTGEQHFGYYDSISEVADINTFKKNTDIKLNVENNVAIQNKLIDIAKQTNSLHTWLRVAGNQLDKIEKAALKPYLVELFTDYLTTIENELTFEADYNPFDSDSDYLLNLVTDNLDDIIVRNKYLQGFDSIYKRLTDVRNLKSYDVLSYDLPPSDKHRLLKVGGISETIPLVVSKSKELDLELDRLINSNESDIFKISDNTPNTLSLVKAVFNNTIKTDGDKLFELSNYSSIGVDMFLLLVDSNILKVIRTEDALLIRKLV